MVVAAFAGCGRVGFDDDLVRMTSGPLAATAAKPTANVNSTVAITASGGVPPYTFAIASGSGAVDAQGRFRSPSRHGTTVIAVTDDVGETAEVTIVTQGAALFGVGGYKNNRSFADVYRSDDAITWTLVGMLPQALGGGILWVQDDAMFWVGGDSIFDNGTTVDTIYRSSDGVTWTQVGTFPRSIAAAGGAVFDGRMWIGPGIESLDSFNTNVWSSGDGTTWRAEAPFPLEIHMERFVEYRGTLYSIGGHALSGNTADVFALDGNAWRRAGAIQSGGEYHAATVFGDKLWVAGGNGLGNIVQTSTDAVTWTRAADLPLAREEGELVEFRGRLYLIAGAPRMTYVTDDGSAWTNVGSYPLDCVGTHVVTFTPP